ncbi:MAG: MucB/RseB C-terminal domain-containing protein [Pseudomonadota bacterium]
MTVSMSIPARRAVLALAAACAVPWALAETRAAASTASAPDAVPPSLDAVEWLRRMHVASRQRSYVGTFVVSAATGNLSSARIWHVADAGQLMERIEVLTGAPRSTFRRNEQVMTFLPDSKVAKSETRENLELFPNLPGKPDSSISELYSAGLLGKGRVAGFDADVVQLAPRDRLRFGYRLWSERRSGLVIALQTIDGEGRVVEQSAFSELQLDAPVKAHALAQMMSNTAGYRVEKSELERTTPVAEGWALKTPVPGFKPVNCYRRALDGAAKPERTMQWTFSDGLASVSLFIEPFDAQRASREETLVLGATHTLTRRLIDKNGDWWLTAVGEVPAQTLEAFAQGLVRTR